MKALTSLEGRVTVALTLSALGAAAVAAIAARWLAPPLAALAGLLLVVPFILWGAHRLTRPWVRVVSAVRDGIVSLRDRDFSLSIARTRDGELDALAQAYNSLGEFLRRERLDLYQRELLLDTVMQSSPLAMVLSDAGGRVVYSNVAARALLNGGRKLEGLALNTVLEAAPAALRAALGGGGDTLFTMDVAGEAEVYHLSQRRFLLNARAHQLLLLKQLQSDRNIRKLIRM